MKHTLLLARRALVAEVYRSLPLTTVVASDSDELLRLDLSIASYPCAISPHTSQGVIDPHGLAECDEVRNHHFHAVFERSGFVGGVLLLVD